MKFGKTIAKRQLDVPDYAASFVNYKGLKKLIKSLGANGATGTSASYSERTATDPQATLQANKATFFFRLERELEKVNAFYLQKEAELKLRLQTLVDKKKAIQSRGNANAKVSTTYITLREGFQQFEHDLSKLQQFVEINATAFSKILKKWDKSSKSRTKELYISRAVEVQPCFNREVISELSDQATTSQLELEAWAEGENVEFTQKVTESSRREPEADESDDAGIRNAVLSENTTVLEEWINRLKLSEASEKACEKVTAIFLASIGEASEISLRVLMDSGFMDFHAEDEINERNCLHEAAIAGKLGVLRAGVLFGVDVGQPDVYGRIPLHYAAMHGRTEMIQLLISVKPSTVDVMDHDNFTSLIHSITHDQRECVRQLIASNARIDPRHEQDFIPLNLACQYGLEEIATILLENGASLLPDAEGLFPQHLVARSGRSAQLLLILQKYGANINEQDKLFQWTPIFHAASEGHLNSLRVLLESGAHPDVLDEKGLSAMYYAAWEGHLDCMQLLATAGRRLGVVGPLLSGPSPLSVASTPSGMGMAIDADGIPDLSLPPPILPLRRYGHNFLENKTLVQLSFVESGCEAVHFDQDSKYPAARLTISSKSSDLIPRNLLLPLNEESKLVSFQIDSLDTFAIDFDIFPTFGSKVLARTIALADTFRNKNSGHCVLPLFDSRLRAIGRISFDFRIIKPFEGAPLEITHFATYWKATSQFDQHSSALITGSSLAGEYIRLHVQLTGDSIPVLYPRTSLSVAGLDVPIRSISHAQLHEQSKQDEENVWKQLFEADVLSQAYSLLAESLFSLSEVLARLPPSVHIDLNVVHPVGENQSQNVNHFVDTILNTVFDHARSLKQISPELTRSIVFSSSDMNVCTALNWKQPNYPVLFSNETVNREKDVSGGALSGVCDSCSVKDAVRFALTNNLMGLI
ncbi:putative ankyrin repeat protein nuc-2 [Sphaerosporella brunnea]|uniref:Putative ankyrin repeat protein nuc-2 n=1 Tax=Sphaerosporella brunnea TaxID=1250544 RepID=A0A5J5ECD7_9PEZI|nr:putative ankyrin repeat protein nuc-2 [Sphaerosporella brunnea]